jgi:hypothetical protein
MHVKVSNPNIFKKVDPQKDYKRGAGKVAPFCAPECFKFSCDGRKISLQPHPPPPPACNEHQPLTFMPVITHFPTFL